MSATPHSEEVAEMRDEIVSEGEAAPSPVPDLETEAEEAEAVADAEEEAYVAGQEAPASPPETETESFIREIPGGAGHGPARAYGYIAIATALGARAELTAGGTRSTSAHPLLVTVQADEETFTRINETYDALAPEAEQLAAAKRDEARKSGPVKSYELSLLSRAVLAGFPQGAASALREPGTTRPLPFREATRARLVDGESHRSAVSAGRAWASRHLVKRAEHHSAA